MRNMQRGNDRERGATTVEYALIVVLAVVVLIGGVELLGVVMAENFTSQQENLESGVPGG